MSGPSTYVDNARVSGFKGDWEADAEEQRLVSEILRDGESLLDMLPEDEAEASRCGNIVFFL